MLRHLSESDRALVEQAKGALMLRYGTGSRESLAVLERWAQEAQVPLREVAEALVGGVCLGRVTTENEGTVRWLEQRLRRDISDVRGDERGTAEGPATATGTVTAAVPTPASPAVSTPAAVSMASVSMASASTAGVSTAAVSTTAVPAAAVPATTVGARQWRYSSAVHAARVLRSR